MKMQITIACAIAALTAGADLAAQSIKDVVVSKNGRRIRGVEVTAMTTSGVKFTRGDTENELPAVELLQVQWHEPPEEFAGAQGAMRRGEFENAANLYAEAASKASRDPMKFEFQFRAAEALVRNIAGDATRAQAALDAVETYLGATPDGFYVPNAMLLKAQAQRAAGDAAAAEVTVGELTQKALGSGWALIWDARAKFERAQAQIAQSKVVEARASFKAAVSAANSAATDKPDNELDSIKAASVVGEGETYVAEKKFDDALRYFRGLVLSEKNPVVRAAAKAGEGEALYLMSQDKGDGSGLRAAQIALAEANLLDVQAGATTAKALYYSGEVLLALGAEKESEDFKQRASEYFDTVVKSYGDTSWAARAASAMKR